MRLLSILPILLLGACTSHQAPPGHGGARTGSPLAGDPCALLTVREVETITGSQVLKSGLVPDDRKIVPAGPNPCEYLTDGRYASITVSVHPRGAKAFAQLRHRDPRNTYKIDGLGDEAFALGLSALYVRVGGGYLWLATQHGAGWPAVRDLRELARAALN
jgi:hypothetical protein